MSLKTERIKTYKLQEKKNTTRSNTIIGYKLNQKFRVKKAIN